MQLIVVSNNTKSFQADQTYLEKLVDEGLDTFHLRKPRSSKKQITDFLEAIPVHLHPRIVLHQFPELLEQFNLKGFYFSKKNKKNAISRWFQYKKLKWQHPGKLFSTGIYDSNSLIKKGTAYDYVFFGPVFSMKKGGRQAIHYDELQLKMLLRKCKAPVFARGGITLENLQFIYRLGFDGYVLQTHLWESNDPVLAFRQVKDFLNKDEYSSNIPMYS